jgi:hypothetical protein
VRELLGGVLLANGDYSGAEKVFRAEILRQPRNGRALFGLAESLTKQGKEGAAKSVQGEFEKAWQYADTKLSVSSLTGLTANSDSATAKDADIDFVGREGEYISTLRTGSAGVSAAAFSVEGLPGHWSRAALGTSRALREGLTRVH